MSKSDVLVLTLSNDSHADHVIGILRERPTQVLRVNLDELGRSTSVSIEDSRVQFFQESKVVCNTRIPNALWVRSLNTRRMQLPGNSAQVKEWIRDEWAEALEGIVSLSNGRCMDKADAIFRAKNKPFQLQLAKKLGFVVPEWMITSEPAVARDFIRNHPRTVAKALHGASLHDRRTGKLLALFTFELDTEMKERLDSITVSPVLLQEYIEKKLEIRATVVGERIFACEIHSQESLRTRVDWRRYDIPRTPHYPHELPSVVSGKLLTMLRSLGLNFGGFDLIVSPSGEYVFLEVNPTAQWLWIEQLTGQPIGRAIAEWLLGER